MHFWRPQVWHPWFGGVWDSSGIALRLCSPRGMGCRLNLELAWVTLPLGSVQPREQESQDYNPLLCWLGVSHTRLASAGGQGGLPLIWQGRVKWNGPLGPNIFSCVFHLTGGGNSFLLMLIWSNSLKFKVWLSTHWYFFVHSLSY